MCVRVCLLTLISSIARIAQVWKKKKKKEKQRLAAGEGTFEHWQRMDNYFTGDSDELEKSTVWPVVRGEWRANKRDRDRAISLDRPLLSIYYGGTHEDAHRAYHQQPGVISPFSVIALDAPPPTPPFISSLSRAASLLIVPLL